MKRALTIQENLTQIHTVEELTEVFESIASLHIAKIRDRVVTSKEFFAELWQTYQGLRIDPKAQMARHKHASQKTRDVFVVVTAEGKLSGQVDEQIIDTMKAAYIHPDQTDVVIVGSRGLSQLRQHNIPVAKAFQLPAGDINFSVSEIVATLDQYRHISVFYQTYESLRTQKVAQIELISAVRELGEAVEEGEVVSSRDYIFEPNIDKIADYMESVMMGVALIQIIMESKLAQYANRYNAMSAAKHRAADLVKEYRSLYYRAKRGEADERLKEMIKVVKHRGRN